MIRLRVSERRGNQVRTKPMKEMQPLEVCVIVSDGPYYDNVVMRTASKASVEVMDLTQPRASGCWGGGSIVEVRELYPGEKYLLELS